MNNQSGKITARIRTGAPNPEAPAWTDSSINKTSERGGFEPPMPFGIHAFEARAFDHSAISPETLGNGQG